MSVQTEEFLSVTKSIVRCSSIRNYSRFHSPTVTFRESNPNRENDLPTEAVAEAKSLHLPRARPLGRGLPRWLLCNKCSRSSFWPQQGMFCSALQGHFCPSLFTVTKTSRRISWPLAWRSKVEFLLWSRSYQNNVRICIIPHDMGSVQSTAIRPNRYIIFLSVASVIWRRSSFTLVKKGSWVPWLPPSGM